MGGVDDEDVDDSNDDDEDGEYAPEDQEADGSEDVEDEDGPHDYNYKDTGSIESEPSEPVDDDAADMRDIDMNTEMDVNSGQSHGSNKAAMPKTLDMEDVKKRDDSHVESEVVNGPNVESEGVDGPNNDITHQEAVDMEERDDNHSIDDQSLGTVEKHDDTDDKMGYNLRRSREQSYKHLYDPKVFNIEKGDDDESAILMTLDKCP